ncbi:hypothetical protein ANCCAN_22899 [Ancylostoma caninum]|uniref:NR LBD domain-containing protein n=1 Tax=Ancylostoma caninum TaxID=29170 RepID=A0A368FGR2_ANCCA|nr:hypothetical protein ANCCAN_22899 [Ancylostoma caninum]
MFVTIEHGLFTAQMPAHDNVWFLSDRTCLVRNVDAIPEEIKLHLTPKTSMAQQLLYPLTAVLIDEIAQPLRKLRPTPEEVAALKVLMLMSKFLSSGFFDQRKSSMSPMSVCKSQFN